MLAAHLLESTSRTAESISEELEFASVSSMRNMFRGYVDLKTSEVRQKGLTHVVGAFLSRDRLTGDSLGGGSSES
jgi:AraC-like DNA-binding protein